MTGRRVLITGANQGIGKATAIALAQRGAHVIVAARSLEKGTRAVAAIRQAAHSDAVDLICGDLSSLAAVRGLAEDVKRRYDALHVLVNNAGVLVPARRTTIDGHEETWAVNHLASFTLTALLLELLKQSGRARIVNVSSNAHRPACMQWQDLEFDRKYRAWRAYGQSKLANVLFTYELARRLEGTGVTANALHPGIVATGFGQTYGGASALLIRMAGPFLRTPAAGAKTSVYLACSGDVEGVTGRYFARSKPVRSSPVSYDEASRQKLWTISEEMTKCCARAA